MKKYSFRPEGGVCSALMSVEIDENNVITSLQVKGGCHGNLQGICRLVKGMKVKEIIDRLSGIRCGDKMTSCPDQLAKGLADFLAKQSVRN